MEHLEPQVAQFVTALKRRTIVGSRETARQATLLLKGIVSVHLRAESLPEILESVRNVGKRLIAAQPMEVSIGNVVRRILYLLKEEYQECMRRQSTTSKDRKRRSPKKLGRVLAERLASEEKDGDLSGNEEEEEDYDDEEDYDEEEEEEAEYDDDDDDDDDDEEEEEEAVDRSVPSSGENTQPNSPGVKKFFSALSAFYSDKRGKEEGGESEHLSATQIHPIPSAVLGELDFSRPFPVKEFRTMIFDAIDELLGEIDETVDNVSAQATEHIHSNEVILTVGRSSTIEKFLRSAAGKKRKFEVIVLEGAPLYGGQEMAASLAQAGVSVTLATDSAVFALMSRVNKVLIGTNAVMANGGLIATSGMLNVALAAKFYRVPLVVCTGLYKLTPLHPVEYGASDHLQRTPVHVLKYEDTEMLEHVHVHNPAFDYIPPEYVGLYITNVGGHIPAYVYKLLSEYYAPDDYQL